MTGNNKNKTVIVAAGGSGTRMNGSIPKQFLKLNKKPVLIHTLENFEKCSIIDEILLVVPRAEMAESRSLIDEWKIRKIKEVIPGGKTRQHSVWNGLRRLSKNCEIVIIHDGVRPFVSDDLIKNTVKSAVKFGAAITAIPIYDTVKRVKNREIEKTLDRSKLWRVQTPQAFRKDLLIKAYKYARENKITATDDSALIESSGQRIRVVKGEDINIKITSPADMMLAELIIKRNE